MAGPTDLYSFKYFLSQSTFQELGLYHGTFVDKADILAGAREQKTINPTNLWAVEYARNVSGVGRK